jgi:hypothetical protein
MPTTTTYPNGQQLVSSALTQVQITNLIQTLTCGAIGVNPPNFSAVRVDWPVQGQPFTQLPNQDACYVACVTEDSEYSRVRDTALTGAGTTNSPLVQVWEYTRNWRVSWVFYGPNSTDRARAVHSAFVFMDFFNDQLNLNNLYPVSDPPEPVRAPENFNAQWWERADFHLAMYEQITENIQPGVATSVEVKVIDTGGQVADITVTQETT